MTDPNPRYPKPDRSNHQPQQNARRDFYPEIDISRGDAVLDDGRDAVVEVWYDSDLEAVCQSIYYSRVDAESWTESEHRVYLSRNHILKGNVARLSVVAKVDAKGHDVWCITEVMEFSET